MLESQPASVSPFGSPYARRLRILLIGWALLAPGLAVSLLLAITQGGTLLDCVPVWNDEISHWRQAATFAHAGFGGGYCTVNEQPARVGHFGPHGPGYPVFYGSIGWLVGCHEASAPMINLALIMASSGVWLWRCQLTNVRLAIAALVTATFWPMLLMLPATMHESLNFALAILLAALLQPLFAQVSPRPGTLAGVVGMIVIASMFRMTWCLLLVPAALVGLRGASWRGKFFGIALMFGFMGVVVFVNRSTCAPYPNYVSDLAQTASTAPKRAVLMAWHRFIENLGRFIIPGGSHPLEVMVRYEVIAALLIASAGIVAARQAPDGARRSASLAFAVSNLVLIVMPILIFYDVADWRDFRVLAPHLLLSLLILIAGVNYRCVVGFVAVNLFLLPPFLGQFAASHGPRFQVDRNSAARMQQVFEAYVEYDPDASGWDNTLLVPGEAVTYPLLTIPRGVNMSVAFSYDSLPTPRSRYLLLRPKDFETLRSQIGLRLLSETPLGALYLNLGPAEKSDSKIRER